MFSKKVYKKTIFHTKFNLLQEITLVNNVRGKINISGYIKKKFDCFYEQIPTLAIFVRY